MTEPKAIVINKWAQGIAPSEFVGFEDLHNIDISNRPGAIRMAPQFNPMTTVVTNLTFTADHTTETFTATAHGFYTGQAVTVSNSGGALPSGLSAATTYFVIRVTADTFQLATTLANALVPTPLTITTNGTGTQRVSTINMGLIKYWAYDQQPNANPILYALDNNGRVWKNQNAGSTIPIDDMHYYLVPGNSATGGTGMAIWKGYLLVANLTTVDAYNLSTGAWTLSAAWNAPITFVGGVTSGEHMMLSSYDGNLYIADNNGTSTGVPATSYIPYVVKVTETGTFDPATGGYAITLDAITLPQYKTITGIVELGSQLVIATAKREIYPYNRDASSTSFTLGIPIVCGEKYIRAIFVDKNLLYISAGSQGIIYVSNLSSTQIFFRIPRQMSSDNDNPITINNFALIGQSLIFSLYTAGGVSGIYNYDLLTKGLAVECETGIESPLFSDGIQYWTQKQDGSSNYVFGRSMNYSDFYYDDDYTSYATTEFMRLGDAVNRATTAQVEYLLSKPLIATQGIKIAYRQSKADNFTTLRQDDFSSVGAVMSGNISAAANTRAIYVQFRISLKGNGGTSSPELLAFLIK